MPTQSEPEKPDIVSEARDFVVTSALYKNPNRARRFIEALCDEVERLRERFSVTCNNCGERYLGPKDETLHGYNVCNMSRCED